MTHYEQLQLALEKIQSLEQEIIKLHSQLAHEKLRADTGWQRYESSNRAHMATLNVIGLKGK